MKIDKRSLKSVLNSLNEYEKKVKFSIDQLGRVAGTNMENYAKDNARWENQTGDARRKFQGYSIWSSPNVLQIGVSHNVPYGVWLELANERKYSILEEARDSQVKDFLSEVKKVINK